MLKILIVSLCILYNCSAKMDKTDLKSTLIGKKYSDAKELGITAGKASELIPNSDFCINWVTFDTTNVMLFCRVDKSINENNPDYIISDALILPEINDSLDLAYRNCNGTQNENQYIIALLRHVEEFTNKNVIKAWNANVKNGKIEEISTEGIECENPRPNLD